MGSLVTIPFLPRFVCLMLIAVRCGGRPSPAPRRCRSRGADSRAFTHRLASVPDLHGSFNSRTTGSIGRNRHGDAALRATENRGAADECAASPRFIRCPRCQLVPVIITAVPPTLEPWLGEMGMIKPSLQPLGLGIRRTGERVSRNWA